MATSSYKFTWEPNTKKITEKDLPENELDKKPGYIEQIRITNLTQAVKDSYVIKEIKKILDSEDYKKDRKGKPQRYNQMPKMTRIKIRDLFTALAVQRRIDFNHLVKIITTWDSRRPATINVIYHPPLNAYFITDGQHTVLAIAIRAMLGLFPDVDPKDYLDVEVNCQVVETSDFSFAREHFLGINGEDKLSILPYDIHKIHVFGKRLDNPNNEAQEKYEIASRKQAELEKYNIIPVHPESVDRFKPGAFIDVNLLKKVDVADITFFGQNHMEYWPQENVDPMEVMPFAELRKRLEKEGADFSSKEFKEFMRDLNALVKTIAGGFAEFKNLTQQLYPEYYERAFNERPKSCPPDASMCLLLQLYKKAGGTYEYVPSFYLNKYCENNKTMFLCLSKEKKELFK